MLARDPHPLSDVYTVPPTDQYADIIRDIEEIELARSSTHLQANSLHKDAYSYRRGVDFDDVLQKQRDIITFLVNQHTLADRFGAVVHPDFAPFIGSVDLGRVQYPSSLAEFQAFESELGGLLDRLNTDEHPVTRFKSNDADCMLQYTTEIHDDSAGRPVVVVTRSRRLAEMDNPVDGSQIKIRKRMMFLLTDPDQYGHLFERQFRTPSGVRTSTEFDVHGPKLQDGLEKADDSIIPISTVYFAYAEHTARPQPSLLYVP